MKYKYEKRILSMIVICCLIMMLSGCSRGYANTTSLVSGLNNYQISVNSNGSVNVYGQADDSYDFNDWDSIRSVVSGIANAGGIKDNGSVVVTGYNKTEACEVKDWQDIKALAFTAFVTFGLKNDGTIIHTGEDLPDGITNFEKEVICDVEEWQDIVDIKGAQLIIAGIKKDGRVVVSAPAEPELEEAVKGWRNIKDLSVSMSMILGVTWSGDVLCAYDNLTNEMINKDVLEQYKELKGAERVFAGQSFVAGLMPDDSFKIRTIELGYEDSEDLMALDGTTNIRDVNNYEEYLTILKNDGSVLSAGYID